MSVLIKDIEKPKFCYAVIDGESEYCPFVNTDDDCVLQLKKGICEGTWADQYSKCPLIEAPEPCEDAVSREDLIKRLNGINGTAELDAVFEIVENMPFAQPDGEYISRQAVTESDLIDWYINSVDESEPVWTEEHIHELFNDFYLIPKEN